jgi:hypothetical protein
MFSHRLKQCAHFDTSVRNKTYAQSNPVCLYMKVDKASDNADKDHENCNILERFDILKKRCVNSRCSSPTEIKHSTLLFTSTSIGMSARYKCNAGYFGTGNPQIVCQPNVTWSLTSFNCTPNTCPMPISVENTVPFELTSSKIGSTFKYSCKQGFYVFGNPEIHCQLNATWTMPKFYCTDEKCPPAMIISGAFVNSSDRSIGSVAHYECTQGFIAFGDPNIHCLENSSWTRTKFACEKLCSVPKSVIHADLVSVDYVGEGSLYRPGTQLNYSCNIDYQGENQTTTSVCDINGIWDPEIVLCCKNGTVSDGKSCNRAFPVQLGMSLSGKCY